jgi:hypothetical protein
MVARHDRGDEHDQRPPRRRCADPCDLRLADPAQQLLPDQLARCDCDRHAAGHQPGRHRRHDGLPDVQEEPRAPQGHGSDLLGNQGQVVGTTTTARKLRSLNAWISGNGSRGAAGADSTGATFASTDETAAGLRAFTETLLKDAILDAYTDGGEPSIVLVSPTNKQLASFFTGRTTQQQIVAEKTILGAASMYASDFGDLKIVPNRTQRGRDVWVVDPSKVAVAFLRSFEPQESAASAMPTPVTSSRNTRWRSARRTPTR